MEDTNKELERLQRELLAEEDPLDEELYALLDDDELPTQEALPQEPIPEPAPAANTDEARQNKLVTGLMIAASALCCGIIGVLIYWLANFVR